jgi:hypothetical protein
MKVVICLVALIAAANAAKTICPMTVCDSSLGDKCYSVTNTETTFEIKIKNCGTSKYCDVTNFSNPDNDASASCVAIPDTDTDSSTTVKAMYPGYSCTKGNECGSGTCGDHGCNGQAKNAACVTFAFTTTKSNEMCGAGLYCINDNAPKVLPLEKLALVISTAREETSALIQNALRPLPSLRMAFAPEQETSTV